MWCWELIPFPASLHPYVPLTQRSVSWRGLCFWHVPSYSQPLSHTEVTGWRWLMCGIFLSVAQPLEQNAMRVSEEEVPLCRWGGAPLGP